MLLQDEQNILQWLTQYGALTRTQVHGLMHGRTRSATEKMIKNLRRALLISDISGGYYLGTDPMSKPDQRIILAVWVLIKFIADVEPKAHYPATWPSQLFFLKQDIGYEIIVLYEGEQHLTRLLQPEEDLKYIFVLPHIKMARELSLPKVPCLFATIDYAGKDEPEILFYSEGDHFEKEKSVVSL